MIISAVITIIGLGIANFIWEKVKGDKDWERARERTYFQASGIAMFMLNQIW